MQAVYQSIVLSKKPEELIEEYITYRLGEDIDGEEAVMPDGTLFTAIVLAAGKNRNDLDPVLTDALKRGQKQETDVKTDLFASEPLLYSILLCGAGELLTAHDIDPPIIISDYLHVAHAFYGQGEAKLVNAVLDRLAGILR